MVEKTGSNNSLELEVKKLKSEIITLKKRFSETKRAQNKSFGELEQYMKLYLEKSTELTSNAIEASSIIRYYANVHEEVTVEDLDGVLDSINTIAGVTAENRKEIPELYSLAIRLISNIMNMLPDLAKECNISSGELLQYLMINNKDLLFNTIDLAYIASAFGTNEATNWKKILEM